MTDYKEMYLAMFRGAEKAQRILTEEPFARCNVHKAVQILEQVQMVCEELYIQGEND